MDRLPNDKFGTSDWVDSKVNGVPDDRPNEPLPSHIENLMRELILACEQAELPVFVAISAKDRTEVLYSLGDKPERCNQGFLLARGTATGIQEYNMGLVLNPAVMTQSLRR